MMVLVIMLMLPLLFASAKQARSSSWDSGGGFIRVRTFDLL